MTLTRPTPAMLAGRGLVRPSARDVHALAEVRDYPCVSIMVNTRPGPRMTHEDRARLDDLVRTAAARIAAEGWGPDDDLVIRLRAMVDQLADVPTDQALAVFATPTLTEYRHLSVAVDERVVVDPTLATRDVLRSLQQNPPFTLLVLDAGSARLYRGEAGTLTEVVDDAFPCVPESSERGANLRQGRARPGRRRGTRAGREEARQLERMRAFLRTVDGSLADELANRSRPVVVIAGDRILSEFLGLTRHADRIAGIARAGMSHPSVRRLEQIVRPLLSEHLADLDAAAQDTLDAWAPGAEVVAGLADCWHSAINSRPQLLLVEQSAAMPARLSDDGYFMRPAQPEEREHPEVIDDAVDELIELVLARGGDVRFVPDGALADRGRVALRVASAQFGWEAA